MLFISGISSKVEIVEDGGTKRLVASKEVYPEEVVASFDPYVAVVNVTGGRAGGKICPHTLEKMFHPVPCKFGGQELFGSVKARDEATESYHQECLH